MYNYNIDIPDNSNVEEILDSDFWISRQVPLTLIRSISTPVKFTSNASIYMSSGESEIDIDLICYKVKAPAVINIRAGQILMPRKLSDDVGASVAVMSKRVWDSIFMLVKDCRSFPIVRHFPVTEIPQEMIPAFDGLYDYLADIVKQKDNPYLMETIIFALTTFFFNHVHACYDRYAEMFTTNRVVDRFINLVQQNFKRERFLDFYAGKLGITSKHLSRTVKTQTGYTAVEWIERYVILEAKVMLKSSNLTIQQISDELCFPSQSFFGKYFKKSTGMSPKEFRNT